MVVVPYTMGSRFWVWGFALGFDPTSSVQSSEVQAFNPEPLNHNDEYLNLFKHII